MASPLVILFTCSLVMGFVSTLIVVISVAVDTWEYSSFDHDKLMAINRSDACDVKKMNEDCIHVTQLSSDPPLYQFQVFIRKGTNKNDSQLLHSENSGLWRTCDGLTDGLRAEYVEPSKTNFNGDHCFIFVTDYDEESALLNEGSKQIARLQNSAASCYIVVLIDLSSAAIVGIIGLAQKQVASCMVTGVLYIMAALFGVFGLSMFHTKHYYKKYQCYALDEIPPRACDAREVEIGYAVPLAWVGVIACGFSCLIWLFVSRALRVIKAKTML